MLYESLTGDGRCRWTSDESPAESWPRRDAAEGSGRRSLPNPSTRVRIISGERAAEVLSPAPAEGRTIGAWTSRLHADRPRLDRDGMKAAGEGPHPALRLAAELAADIEAPPAQRTGLAGPPSAGYRAGKLVRRHRSVRAPERSCGSALVIIGDRRPGPGPGGGGPRPGSGGVTAREEAWRPRRSRTSWWISSRCRGSQY